MISESKALEIIRSRLSPHRWQHSLGTALTAREIADHWGADKEKAYLAGILHDYARDLPGDELVAIATQQGLIEDAIELKVPELLHAPVGAFLLAQDLDLEDPEILEAIRVHTLGSECMDTLGKIIFLADMIEPGRRPFAAKEAIRRSCYADLDRAMLMGLEATIGYCLQRGRLLHPRTVRARNSFLLGLAGE